MTERMVVLDEEPARLSVRNRCLVVKRGEEEESIPLGETAVVVVSQPCVSFTQAVLSGMAEAGGVLVVCNSKHMPAAMMLPLEAHFTQGERFVLQAQASVPTKKRLWKSIVQAKVRAQARLLEETVGGDAGLRKLVAVVKSGDVDNVEAEASRRYWPLVFGDSGFRRDRYGEPPNQILNYGYAVLRAVVARAVCAAGLHPSLGLHHHNRYDAFCLADDLMEPFRPIVDRAVAAYWAENREIGLLDKEVKGMMLGSLLGRFRIKRGGRKKREENRTLFDIAARLAGSLADVYSGKRKNLEIMEMETCRAEE